MDFIIQRVNACAIMLNPSLSISVASAQNFNKIVPAEKVENHLTQPYGCVRIHNGGEIVYCNAIVRTSFSGCHGVCQVLVHLDTAGRPVKITGDSDSLTMTVKSVLEDTNKFLEHLGLSEEPFGVYYDNTRPEKAFGPKPGMPISRELEDQGKLDMQEVFKRFSCVMGNIWLARKKHRAAYISPEEYGCPGGVFYCSMMKPNVRFIEHCVTTGFSGTPLHGERFLPSPEAMRKFLDKVNPRKAPAKYCIFKPLSLFTDSEEPEFVIFFARPEVLTGLFIQTTFTTGDVDCVASPFGAGCTNIIAWPLFYKEQGVEKAIIGGFDPSARKFMKTDELTFTVPWSL